MSEPWCERNSTLYGTNREVIHLIRSVTSNVTDAVSVAVNLTCYTAVAGFVYMSMLRREFREQREFRERNM